MRTIFLIFFVIYFQSSAQNPDYSTPVFEVVKESDIYYGTSTDYRNELIDLYLDIYKPIGNECTNRPLILLLYGGSFVGGCKEGMELMATDFASRGYVAAAIQYRLGFHKSTYVSNAMDLTAIGIPVNYRCLYTYDSLEIKRAGYRAMQDAKGAIRFLRARHLEDSTSLVNVFIGGESAGAITSLTVASLDLIEEKPIAAYELGDAGIPDPNLQQCGINECVSVLLDMEDTAYARPDLGSIDGTLNINGYSSRVRAAISFAGGVPYDAYANNWIQGTDTASFYFFHWTCDAIVPSQFGTIAQGLNAMCVYPPGFTTTNYNYPNLYGGIAIHEMLTSIGVTSVGEFYNCDNYNSDLWSLECIRITQNGGYHYLPDPVARVNKICTDLLIPLIEDSTEYPCIDIIDGILHHNPQKLNLWPMPNNGEFYVELPDENVLKIELVSMAGYSYDLSVNSIHTSHIKIHTDAPSGLYFLRIITPTKLYTSKMYIN